MLDCLQRRARRALPSSEKMVVRQPVRQKNCASCIYTAGATRGTIMAAVCVRWLRGALVSRAGVAFALFLSLRPLYLPAVLFLSLCTTNLQSNFVTENFIYRDAILFRAHIHAAA